MDRYVFNATFPSRLYFNATQYPMQSTNYNLHFEFKNAIDWHFETLQHALFVRSEIEP